MNAPEIWFKSQRMLRTIVQALVVLVPLANGVAVAASAYLSEQTHLVIPGWAFVVLNGVVAVTALVMGLVARLMAVPGFNDWLTRIGLGSVPRNAVEMVQGGAGTWRSEPDDVNARVRGVAAEIIAHDTTVTEAARRAVNPDEH